MLRSGTVAHATCRCAAVISCPSPFLTIYQHGHNDCEKDDMVMQDTTPRVTRATETRPEGGACDVGRTPVGGRRGSVIGTCNRGEHDMTLQHHHITSQRYHLDLSHPTHTSTCTSRRMPCHCARGSFSHLFASDTSCTIAADVAQLLAKQDAHTMQ